MNMSAAKKSRRARRRIKRQFRVNPEENARYSKLARDRGMTFAKLIRQLLDAEIARSAEGKAA